MHVLTDTPSLRHTGIALAYTQADHADQPYGILLCQICRLDSIGDMMGDKRRQQIVQTVYNMLHTYLPGAASIAQTAPDRFEVIFAGGTKQQMEHSYYTLESVANSFENNRHIYALLKFACAHSTSDYASLSSLAEIKLFNTDYKTVDQSIIYLIEDFLSEATTENKRHIQAMDQLSAQIADALTLSNADRIRLKKLVRYHDIGKTKVPLHILNKNGLLTQEQWDVIKGHSLAGYVIAKSTDHLYDIRDEILHHHENYDGSGYPDGLSGTDIPLLARIIKVADAYDCMIHQQPYHRPLSKELAIDELNSQKGHLYDPRIAEILLDIIHREPEPDTHQAV